MHIKMDNETGGLVYPTVNVRYSDLSEVNNRLPNGYNVYFVAV